MIRRVDYLAVVYLVLVHALALLGLLLPIRAHWIPAAALVYASVVLGSTVGLHRLLAHRSFRCPKWVEYALVSAAMLTAQGSPLLWVATHRRHHAHSDSEGDPHSPRLSFWYGHIGWLVDAESTDPRDSDKYCRDLKGDPYYLWLLRYRLVPQAIAVLAIALTLGWAAVPFAFFLPCVTWMQVNYSLNSICHTRRPGARVFETSDNSSNAWWLALPSFGESWHNNHHGAPRSARFGVRLWQVDIGYIFVRALAALGLAWDVRLGPASSLSIASPPERGGTRS